MLNIFQKINTLNIKKYFSKKYNKKYIQFIKKNNTLRT